MTTYLELGAILVRFTSRWNMLFSTNWNDTSNHRLLDISPWQPQKGMAMVASFRTVPLQSWPKRWIKQRFQTSKRGFPLSTRESQQQPQCFKNMSKSVNLSHGQVEGGISSLRQKIQRLEPKVTTAAPKTVPLFGVGSHVHLVGPKAFLHRHAESSNSFLEKWVRHRGS